MKTEVKHSPTPWELKTNSAGKTTIGPVKFNGFIAPYIIEGGDAAFIVRACNSHEALVALVKDARNLMMERKGELMQYGLKYWLEGAEAALALSGEGA